MYSFRTKDNGPDLEITVTRAMLAVSATATLVYRSDDYFFINILGAVALVLGAIFINWLLAKFSISKFGLMAAAAIVLLIATRSIVFAAVLLVYGSLLKFLKKKPVLLVSEEGITIKKLFTSPAYTWNDFSNVILKDNLLTLDFKSNKLIQVNIDESDADMDAAAFNTFCKKLIGN